MKGKNQKQKGKDVAELRSGEGMSRATIAGHLAAVLRLRPALVTVAHPHHRQLHCPHQAAKPASLLRHHASPSIHPTATTVTEKRRRRGAELESRRRRPWGLELRRYHRKEGEDAGWRSKMSPSVSVVLEGSVTSGTTAEASGRASAVGERSAVDPPELLAAAGAVARPELESGLFIPLVAVSAFERASRVEVLTAGDFGLSEKESVNEFGIWICSFEPDFELILDFGLLKGLEERFSWDPNQVAKSKF
ncbi:uncharacterized protein DS421_6g189310 [Arachis hypogaea]|nr:uncharacterized protein DS421_6g189310 [Arachis hypogaea]